MKKLYNFSRLVRKYSNPFTLTVYGTGTHVDGRYQKGQPTEYSKFGAILPLSQRKIYQSGGTLTSADRQLYMLERIEESLKGSRVTYQGKTYAIEEDTDYTDFSDVSVYVLRWVDFNEY